jgi:Ca2+-binding RTX toxin-like protein
VNLPNANVLTNLGAFSSNGLTVNDSAGGLTVTGTINGGTGATSITTTGGTLAIGGNPISGTNVTLAANGATGDITSSAGGTVNGGTGFVQLTAGRNVTLGAAVSAGTTATVNFGQSTGGTFATTAAITGTPVAINGGAGNDTFDFSGAPAITATLAGGGGTDTLMGRNVANAWNISGPNAGSVGGLTFSAITNLTGGTAADTLTGVAGGSAWSITGANAVTVSGMNGTSMNALVGGAGNDTFTLASAVPTFNARSQAAVAPTRWRRPMARTPGR